MLMISARFCKSSTAFRFSKRVWSRQPLSRDYAKANYAAAWTLRKQSVDVAVSKNTKRTARTRKRESRGPYHGFEIVRHSHSLSMLSSRASHKPWRDRWQYQQNENRRNHQAARHDDRQRALDFPSSLRPLWPKLMEDQHWWSDPPSAVRASASVLTPALAKEFSDVPQRIRALFAWFGSGAGPWSGFPAYEDVPAHLLPMRIGC